MRALTPSTWASSFFCSDDWIVLDGLDAETVATLVASSSTVDEDP
jgi:hypothetical protein